MPGRHLSRNGFVSDRRRFLGRDQDLASVEGLLASRVPVVTIVGPAGVGKTQLARHVAQRLQDAGRVEVVWCDLSAARTAADAAHALVAALGREATSNAEEEVARALVDGDRPLVVVLDNVEQLTHVAGDTIGVWGGLGAARLLLTSRERLRIAGETIHELGPLRRDDAIDLLFERARKRGDGSAEERALAGRVVDDLDRLPLAIELAASRLDVLTLPQLQQRLTARFDLLGWAARDAPARHQTLRAALEWSWDLLDEAEKQALAQCAVFRGGFALEAAEAIIEMSDPARSTLDVIHSLVDKSLVVAAGAAAGERRLDLYQSVRELALEKLTAGGGFDAVAGRHSRYFAAEGAAWVAGLERSGFADCKQRLAEEAANLEAVVEQVAVLEPALAVRAALALSPPHSAPRSPEARIALLDRALIAAGRASDPALEAEVLLSRAEARTSTISEIERAHIDLEGAAERAAAAGRADLEAIALARRAHAGALSGDREEDWSRLLARASERAREADERCAGLVLHLRALSLRAGGAAVAEVKRHLEDARDLFGRAGFSRFAADMWAHLGELDADAGDLEDALASYDEWFAFAERAGNRQVMQPFVRQVRGTVLHLLGRLAEAHAELVATRDESRDLGLAAAEAEAAGSLAILCCELGRYDEARREADRAVELAEWAGWPTHRTIAAARRAALDALHGDPAGAEAELSAMSATTATIPWLDLAVDLLRGIVEVAAAEQSGADRAAAEERLAAAGARLERGRSIEDHRSSWQARSAVRWLAHEIDRVRRGYPIDAPSERQLDVGRDATWFAWHGGERVSLDRRHVARRLLRRLLAARAQARDEVVSREALVDAAWPGEAMTARAATRRLLVAVSTLRKLGLGSSIVTGRGGYLLAPSVRVNQED